MKETEIRAVNTIRCLSADIVQKAKSGHPGMPMGMAGVAFLLFSKLMRHNPQNPKWFNRDRFILSSGHGSALLYSLLHLCGYEKMTMSELKSFRQWGSLTAGHPEYMPDAGIEITTGPLGQGIANAVGLAMAAKYTAAYFNEPGFPLVTHKTFVIAGDGCMQEGISGEACSLAGHLKLDNLFVIYDSNSITIDGSTSLSFSEDVVMRYRAYGWHTVVYNGDTEDISAVEAKLRSEMEKQDRPVLFVFPSVIGYGSPNKAGTKDVHGSPLGDEELKLTKQNLGMDPNASFNIPAEVHDYFNGIKSRLQKTEADWEQLLEKYRGAFPEKHAQFISGAKPSAEAFSKALPVFDSGEMATRSASGKVLDAVMPLFPMIVGGSADLTPSNNTRFKDVQDFMPDNYKGRYIRYGVREHAMAAINNGISVHGLTRAYGATFLCFSDYARPAIRLAALSHYPSVFIGTHDSIGLGEDGPTHQPVEHLEALRAIPGLRVLRPADANETACAWRMILTDDRHSYVLALTRQNLPALSPAQYDMSHFSKGGYVLSDRRNPSVLIIATGSEVSVALKAQSLLDEKNIAVRVISMPSRELFESQPQTYRDSVILPGIGKRAVIEAGVMGGWAGYVSDRSLFIGMNSFGASAPDKDLFNQFGITAEAVAAKLSA